MVLNMSSWLVLAHPIALPHVLGGPHAYVSMDDECIVDIDEHGQLLLAVERAQLHPLQLHRQLTVLLKEGALGHGLVVHKLPDTKCSRTHHTCISGCLRP